MRCGRGPAGRAYLLDDRRRRCRRRGALRHRRDDRQVIELLQRARSPSTLRRAAGQHHDLRAVHPGRCHRADAVRDAGTRGDGRAANTPGHLGPSFGGEHDGLLVTRVDQPHVAALHRAVVEDEEVTARQREHRVDAVAAQHLDREPTSVRLHPSTARRRATR